MTAKFTEATTGSAVTISGLATLADDTAAVSAAQSNDASNERHTLTNFMIAVGTQGSARAGSPNQVSLLIVPEVNAAYGDVATLETAGNFIAQYDNGDPVTFTMDAAVTARNLTACGVRLPNGNYKVGVLNETGQAFAGTNSVYQTGNYAMDDV